MKTQTAIFRWLVVLALTIGSSVLATAGSFSVNPVRIELSPARRNSVVQVTNYANEPVTIQAHLVTWAETETKELPTDTVLLNPPIFTVAPGQTQFLRLGLRVPNAGADEQAFRLVLDEVPPAAQPGFTGLRTVLRLRIPVFSRPAEVVVPRLSWEAAYQPDGALRIIALNAGTAHARVRDLTVFAEPGLSFSLGGPVYLLPGEIREWTIEDHRLRGITRVRLTATTEAGGVDESLSLRSR